MDRRRRRRRRRSSLTNQSNNESTESIKSTVTAAASTAKEDNNSVAAVAVDAAASSSSSCCCAFRKESFAGGPIPCVTFLSRDVCLYGQGPFLHRASIWKQDSQKQQQCRRLEQKLLVFDSANTGGGGGGNIHGIRHVQSPAKDSYTVVFGGRKLAFIKGAAADAADDDDDDNGQTKMELLFIQNGTTRKTPFSFCPTSVGTARARASHDTFYELSDWIWDVQCQHETQTPASKENDSNPQQAQQQQLLLVGLAHNQVIILAVSLRPVDDVSIINNINNNTSICSSHIMWIQPMRKVHGATRCISYCMDINISSSSSKNNRNDDNANNDNSNNNDDHDDDHAMVAVGTVMNDILIWKIDLQQKPQQHESFDESSSSSASIVKSTIRNGTNNVVVHEEAPHFHKLQGHKGVLHAVRFNRSGSLLASASDDRSVKLWTRCIDDDNNNNNNSNDSCCWKEKWTAWGHSARCWNVSFCQNDTVDNNPYNGVLLSTGEDGTARVWHIETGAALAVLRGHATGAGIWSVDCLYSSSSSSSSWQHLQQDNEDDDDDGNNNNTKPLRIAMTGASNGTVAFYNLDGYMTNVNDNNINHNQSSSCITSDVQVLPLSPPPPPPPPPLWTRQIIIPDDRPQQQSLQQSNHAAQDADTNTNHIPNNDGNDVISALSDCGDEIVDQKKRTKKKKVTQQIIVGMSFYTIKQDQIPSDDVTSRTLLAVSSSLGLLVATRSGSLMTLIMDKSHGEIVNNNNNSHDCWIHHDGGWVPTGAMHGTVSASDGCCMALDPSSSMVAIGTMRGDIVLTRLKAAAAARHNVGSHRPGVMLNARDLKSAQQLKWLEHDVLLSLHIRSARRWRIPPSLLFQSDSDGDSTMDDDDDFLQRSSSMTFQLTTKKSVVSCAAFHKQTNRLILGDTRGNLSLFDTVQCWQKDGDTVAPLLPVSVLPRIHQKEHVNDIIWMNNGRVLSVGNDGCVHESGIDMQSGTLYPRLSLPVAGFTGITNLWWEMTGGNVVLAGYRGNELAIMDYITGYEFFRKDTGGRARAGTIDLGLQCHGQLSVVVCANERDGRNKLLCDLVGYGCKDLFGRQLVHSIGIGLHHESIYDACLFPLGSRSDVLAFLTGSEDCSARISVWKQGMLTTSRPLPSQESGVRAVCNSRHAGSTTALMAVGGSKLSLQFFSLDDFVEGNDDSIPVTFLGWGRSPEKALIDHRINTVKATPIQFENGNNCNDNDDKHHLVAAGDSNGSLYIYKVSQTQKQSSSCYIGTLAFRSSRPILSLEYLRVDQIRQHNATILLLLVGTTAGTVYVIDVSAAATTHDSLDAIAATFPVTPLASYQAHSMGVNAIAAAAPRLQSLPLSIEGKDATVGFVVCSGGDDQALCCATIVVRLLLLQDDGDDDETHCCGHYAGKRFNVEVTDLRKVKEASASALKGVQWIDECHFVSVGYSQRLELWRYGYGQQQSLDRVASTDTEVGDVCFLAACHETRGGEDHVVVAVGGAGVEFFSLPQKCIPSVPL